MILIKIKLSHPQKIHLKSLFLNQLDQVKETNESIDNKKLVKNKNQKDLGYHKKMTSKIKKVDPSHYSLKSFTNGIVSIINWNIEGSNDGEKRKF